MATVSDFLNEWHNDKPYVVAHTSGSTGRPKEIRLPKSDMAASAAATNLRFGIGPESVLGLPLSIDYIAGKMMCVRALLAGCKLYEMPVSREINIDRHIDLLAIVPQQIDSLASNASAAEQVKSVIIGGAAPSHEQLELLRKYRFNAFLTYGMTETCSHVALADISDPELTYKAMPGISFDTDSRDCLVVDAPNFSFGRLVTNDIVKLIDNQSFQWIGRIDNVINSGGIKISAEALEKGISALVPHPFYIVGIDSADWGQTPALVVECGQDEALRLLAKIRSKIDHRRAPSVAFGVPVLPRTPNGKIIRNKPTSKK